MTKDEALKLALEALEDSMYPQKKQFDAIVGLKQALAQPEQSQTSGYAKKIESLIKERDELRQALAQPEQEPYCWVQSKLSQGMFYKEKPRRIHTIPLFTAPPSKPWVSLTDEEIAYAVGSPIDEVYLADFRKVEAALRSKNNG